MESTGQERVGVDGSGPEWGWVQQHQCLLAPILQYESMWTHTSEIADIGLSNPTPPWMVTSE